MYAAALDGSVVSAAADNLKRSASSLTQVANELAQDNQRLRERIAELEGSARWASADEDDLNGQIIDIGRMALLGALHESLKDLGWPAGAMDFTTRFNSTIRRLSDLVRSQSRISAEREIRGMRKAFERLRKDHYIVASGSTVMVCGCGAEVSMSKYDASAVDTYISHLADLVLGTLDEGIERNPAYESDQSKISYRMTSRYVTPSTPEQ